MADQEREARAADMEATAEQLERHAEIAEQTYQRTRRESALREGANLRAAAAQKRREAEELRKTPRPR